LAFAALILVRESLALFGDSVAEKREYFVVVARLGGLLGEHVKDVDGASEGFFEVEVWVFLREERESDNESCSEDEGSNEDRQLACAVR
jgi:hypothetical protein